MYIVDSLKREFYSYIFKRSTTVTWFKIMFFLFFSFFYTNLSDINPLIPKYIPESEGTSSRLIIVIIIIKLE